MPFVSSGSIFVPNWHKAFLLLSNVKLNYLVMQGLFKNLHLILKEKLCEKRMELQ